MEVTLWTPGPDAFTKMGGKKEKKRKSGRLHKIKIKIGILNQVYYPQNNLKTALWGVSILPSDLVEQCPQIKRRKTRWLFPKEGCQWLVLPSSHMLVHFLPLISDWPLSSAWSIESPWQVIMAKCDFWGSITGSLVTLTSHTARPQHPPLVCH